MMDDFDDAIDATTPMNIPEFGLHEDIPEPIDQWAVEDFEQFAALIVHAD